MTLRGHIVAVKSLQAVLVALPVALHVLTPQQRVLNPPLGPLDDFVIPLALIVVGVASFLPWLIKTKKKTKQLAWWSGVLCFLFLFWFAVSIQQSIVRVDIPSRNTFVLISIGRTRTEFAREHFPQTTDFEMLHQRGFTEGDIHLLWTDSSILENRIFVLASYIGTLAMLNLFIGSMATATRSGNRRTPHAPTTDGQLGTL